LLAWRISWQYADPRYVQPSSCRPRRMVLSNNSLCHATASRKYLNCSCFVTSLHYLFDGLQKGTGVQGRPSRSFLPVNAASLKIGFVATSYNLYCNTNHCCSFTLQCFYHFTVRPLSFKETILSLTYFDRIAMVSLSQLNQHVLLATQMLVAAKFRTFRFFGRSQLILGKSLPICGRGCAAKPIQKNVSEERRHF